MGRPKALLPIQGRTFLENILDAVSRTSIEDTIVVLGHHRDQIERSVSWPSVVFNPDYEQGMITSFQAGIRAIPPNTIGSFLFLVDHPVIEAATIEALISALAPNRVVLPVHQGRRGHPVLFASELLQEVLALPPS